MQSLLFNSNSNLKSIYIPASLVNIDPQVFTGAPNIDLIEIDPNNPVYTVIAPATLMLKNGTNYIYFPSTITNFEISGNVVAFGKTLFQSCEKLTSVTVESNNTKFSAEGGIIYSKDYSTAIACIGGITTVSINSQCKTIGDYCFYQISKLQTLTLNSGLLLLNSYAFAYVILETLSIPETVTIIDSNCFYYSDVKTVITNGGGPNTIGVRAFYHSNTTTINLGSNLNLLSNQAFSTSKITTITFDPSCPLSTIYYQAFVDCKNLLSIEIPKNVLSIGDICFSGATSLKSLTFAEGSVLNYIETQAFKGIAITSLVLPATMTYIGANAFASCTNLETISFATGSIIETIGGGIFKDCISLVNVTIPSSVSNFDPSTFNGCKNLVNITVSEENSNYTSYEGIVYVKSKTKLVCCPGGKVSANINNNIIVIGSNAFYGCSKLENLTFEIGCQLEEIQEGTFYSCTALKRVDLPTSLQTVQQNAFAGCTLLAIITFPDYSMCNLDAESVFSDCSNLETITFGQFCALTVFGKNIFSNCVKLSSINIPANCTTIKEGAFLNCQNLSNIIFESGSHITTIENNVFSGCSSLTEFTLPDSITDITSSCFGNSTYIKIVNVPANCAISKIGSNAFSSFPLETINFGSGTTVSLLEDSAFLNKNIVTFKMNSPLIISSNAFKGCKKLTTISIDGVTSIGNFAFSGCTSLRSFSVPQKCKSLGDNCFQGCSLITSITFVSTPTIITIRSNCMAGLTIASITIPQSVTTIGNGCFSGCTILSSIIFEANSNLASIGSNCFSGCTSLMSFTTPDSFTVISASTFGSAPSITDVFIPAGLTITKISNGAFESFPLKSITFGSGTIVNYLEDSAFENKKLESFTLDCPVIVGSNVFKGCTNLKTVSIPHITSSINLLNSKRLSLSAESLYTIPIGLFDGCSSLTNIDINTNIVNISDYAFNDCKLLNFRIPETTQYIGDYSFYNCKQISYIPNSVVHLGNSSFSGTNIGRTLIVSSLINYIGKSCFSNTLVRKIYYCSNFDFSGFALAFEPDARAFVTFQYPENTFCGILARHLPGTTCKDIMETNLDGYRNELGLTNGGRYVYAVFLAGIE